MSTEAPNRVSDAPTTWEQIDSRRNSHKIKTMRATGLAVATVAAGVALIATGILAPLAGAAVFALGVIGGLYTYKFDKDFTTKEKAHILTLEFPKSPAHQARYLSVVEEAAAKTQQTAEKANQNYNAAIVVTKQAHGNTKADNRHDIITKPATKQAVSAQNAAAKAAAEASATAKAAAEKLTTIKAAIDAAAQLKAHAEEAVAEAAVALAATLAKETTVSFDATLDALVTLAKESPEKVAEAAVAFASTVANDLAEPKEGLL